MYMTADLPTGVCYAFQLQRCPVARVVLFHPAGAVYSVHGGRDADLTPGVISRGKSSRMVFLILISLGRCVS